MTRADITDRILARLAEWSDRDIARLDALIAMGSPSSLHAGGHAAPTESRTEHGIREVWITGAESMRRANVLTAWRDVSQACRKPLPAPGKAE